MTDLETLLRETFAAHEHLADRPMTSTPPTRSIGGPLLAVGAVAATVALAVGVAVSLPDGGAPTPTQDPTPTATSSPTPPDTINVQQLAAQQEGAVALAAVAERALDLPGNVAPVEPGQATELASLTTYLRADEHRTVQSASWTVPAGSPGQVLEQLARHPPRGFTVDAGPREVGADHQISFRRAGLVDVLPRASILVQAVPWRGGVAFRATAIVPVEWDRLPAQRLGPHVIDAEVTWGDNSVHVTDPGQVADLARAYADLDVELDLARCGAYTADRVRVTMTSTARTLTATLDPCGGWQVTDAQGDPVGPGLQDEGRLRTLAKQVVVAG